MERLLSRVQSLEAHVEHGVQPPCCVGHLNEKYRPLLDGVGNLELQTLLRESCPGRKFVDDSSALVLA